METTNKNLGERLMAVEIEVKNIKEVAEQTKIQNTAEHLEIKQMIKDFIESADAKYAPKWVANLIYFVLAGAFLFVLQAILKSAGLK